MSAKFEKFVDALEALCREHGVQLSTSGYDLITVSDIGPENDPIFGDPIYGGRDQIKDRTKDQP